MPITPTNVTKNSITPTSGNKAGYALWGDLVATWGDPIFGWGSPYATFSNVSKNSITPTNQAKS
jgi:hypothetical protein